MPSTKSPSTGFTDFPKREKEFVLFFVCFLERWPLECPSSFKTKYPRWRFRSRALSSVGWPCLRRLTSLGVTSPCLSGWRHFPSSGFHTAARSLLWRAFQPHSRAQSSVRLCLLIVCNSNVCHARHELVYSLCHRSCNPLGSFSLIP